MVKMLREQVKIRFKIITSQCLGTAATPRARDVVLYGFGRIGRLLARLLLSKSRGNGQGLLLRAIVVRKKKIADLRKRAELLLHDSVHGEFDGVVRVDEEKNTIVANGQVIQLIYSKGPDQVDYTAYGISNAIVIDNTGIWKDKEGMSLHLKSKGVDKVLLTAPGSGVVNIVEGVNHDMMKQGERLVSAASCSTNAAVPVLKVVHDAYGIESGHIETVHSFTNGQNLVDNFSMKQRRGRAACTNIILTTTGAGKAVAKCIPSLKGCLTASCIRVPTPNVSILVMHLRLKSMAMTLESLSKLLSDASSSGPLRSQIDFITADEASSTDHIGNRHSSIVDSKNTKVHGKRCTLYVWYDNEFGYSCQTFRLLQRMAAESAASIDLF